MLPIDIWFNAHSGPILFPFSFTSRGETMLCAARTDRTSQEDRRECEPSISNSRCAQPALGLSLSYSSLPVSRAPALPHAVNTLLRVF